MADSNLVTLNPATKTKIKDPTAASRARRARAKRKIPIPLPVEKVNEIKPDVTVVTPRHGAVDVTAYGAAIGLAGAAAWFSIRGMVVLFPGSPLSVIGMACAMEIAKLVTAGWLARRWRATALVWRIALVVLVAGLAVINAAGVYAQLVAAHVGERGAATGGLEIPGAALAA